MNTMSPFFALLAAIMLLSACGESYIDPADLDSGTEYYPVNEGHWVSYRLDSIIYDAFSDSVITLSSTIKEEIGERFVDEEGNDAVRINRYVLNEDAQSWEALGAWYATIYDDKLEKVEENLRFIKLIFPVNDGRAWAGNAKIDMDIPGTASLADWQYTYEDVGLSGAVEGQTYQDMLTVVQNDYGADNLIQRIYAKEQYARDVGLVYKEFWDLSLVTSAPTLLADDPWPGRANSGIQIKMWALDSGN